VKAIGLEEPGRFRLAETPAPSANPEFPSWLDPGRGVIKAVVEF